MDSATIRGGARSKSVNAEPSSKNARGERIISQQDAAMSKRSCLGTDRSSHTTPRSSSMVLAKNPSLQAAVTSDAASVE